MPRAQKTPYNGTKSYKTTNTILPSKSAFEKLIARRPGWDQIEQRAQAHPTLCNSPDRKPNREE